MEAQPPGASCGSQRFLPVRGSRLRSSEVWMCWFKGSDLSFVITESRRLNPLGYWANLRDWCHLLDFGRGSVNRGISCMLINTQLLQIHVESLDETWVHGALKEPMIIWVSGCWVLNHKIPPSPPHPFIFFTSLMVVVQQRLGKTVHVEHTIQKLSFIKTTTHIQTYIQSLL